MADSNLPASSNAPAVAGSAVTGESAYRPFDSIVELIEHFARYLDVRYQAPLDVYLGVFEVKRFTIDKGKVERSTVTVWNRDTGTLKLNLVEHFDRFRIQNGVR